MTGYGKGECILYDRKFIIEIKSINHRYNDINIKIPHSLFVYEDIIKKNISKKVFRGKTDVLVTFDTFSKDDIKVNVNEVLAENYVEALNIIKEKFGIKQNISLELISRFPDVIKVDKKISDEENDKNEVYQCLFCALDQAINNFISMRETEGNNLKENILIKLEKVYNYTKNIEKIAPTVSVNYKKRLMEKIKEINEDINIDENRIITEVTIFADKSCIDEELTRLFSHINQMKMILDEENAIGRKLDFLVQEMNREVNTIGSKSNDLEITNNVIELKSEIEKIREQIQNIE